MDDNKNINTEPLTKKEKAESAGKDIVEAVGRSFATSKGGQVGAKVYNKVVNTRHGQRSLSKVTNAQLLNKGPAVRTLLANNQQNIRRAKSVVSNAGVSNDSSYSATINDSYNDVNDKDIKGNGVVTGLFNKLPLKVKLIIIGVIAGLVFIVIFLVVLIMPVLIELGYIKVDENNGGGLGYSSNTYLRNIGNDCSSIIVGDTAVNLEDYVAGVVSDEAYTSEGMEALKAQAIAARTYAIVRTNHCKNAIKNSSADQNYTSNIAKRARQAADETKGLVLTYNSELFLSEYDSFYKKGDYSCDDNVCSVTYTKLPNKEKHTINVSSSREGQLNGGHGRGMSQVASYEMAKNGYKFDYILNYFYSPGIEIKSLYGSSGYTNGVSASISNFISRTSIPNTNNEHDKKYYYSNENISYATGNLGQCTWYAYGRANEILDQANSDLQWSYAPHAKDWFDYNLSSKENAFSYSTDVNEPIVGAIIVWKSDQFGHVAVVEKVNSDGTIDYSEANIASVKNASNPYGFRYQSNISYTGDGVGTISNIWDGYEFVGYIYMVE